MLGLMFSRFHLEVCHLSFLSLKHFFHADRNELIVHIHVVQCDISVHGYRA